MNLVIAMEVGWTLSYYHLHPKQKAGHHMVVVLLSSLLTLYTDATRCPLATSIHCASCGKLCFCHTMICCCFLTMVNFAKQSMRCLSGESHGKASTFLTLDCDPTLHLCRWKVHMKSGIGTLSCSSRACWRILTFRTSSIMCHFNSTMLVVIANMKMSCWAIGLGNRL